MNTLDTPSEGPKRLCQQCNQARFKYKCPGCEMRTCSLNCSKAHKEAMGCNGERDKTQFVARKDYDGNNMISDYGFLQDLSREQTNAQRDRTKIEGQVKGGMAKYKMMVKMARSRRGIKVVTMSPGLKRHKNNRTNWNNKRGQLFWTLELCFRIGDIPLWVTEHGFLDTCCLADLLTAYVDGEVGDDGQFKVTLPTDDGKEYTLRSHASVSDIKQIGSKFADKVEAKSVLWLLKVPLLSANQPTYREIDPKQPLYSQLKHQTILEYPTIEIHAQAPKTSSDGYPIKILPLVSEDPAYQEFDPDQPKEDQYC